MEADVIYRYFPELNDEQRLKFASLGTLYRSWNERINLISRKDMEEFYLHHVLHSLSIARLIRFAGGSSIMDAGTGGGFPGIPLAIMFPQCNFYLVDSIAKKIMVVNDIASALGLHNVTAVNSRVEDVPYTFDFVVSRAVTALPEFTSWVKNKINPGGINTLQNGILYLKGEDAKQELRKIHAARFIFDISAYFAEAFFETKKIVYLYALK